MKNKPTEKEKEKELAHLRHMETCFLTLYVSSMIAGLTLFVTLEENYDLQTASSIMFIFSLFLR